MQEKVYGIWKMLPYRNTIFKNPLISIKDVLQSTITKCWLEKQQLNPKTVTKIGTQSKNIKWIGVFFPSSSSLSPSFSFSSSSSSSFFSSSSPSSSFLPSSPSSSSSPSWVGSLSYILQILNPLPFDEFLKVVTGYVR